MSSRGPKISYVVKSHLPIQLIGPCADCPFYPPNKCETCHPKKPPPSGVNPQKVKHHLSNRTDEEWFREEAQIAERRKAARKAERRKAARKAEQPKAARKAERRQAERRQAESVELEKMTEKLDSLREIKLFFDAQWSNENKDLREILENWNYRPGMDGAKDAREDQAWMRRREENNKRFKQIQKMNKDIQKLEEDIKKLDGPDKQINPII